VKEMRFTLFRKPIEEYFSEIYGLDEVKRILVDACRSPHPVSILLHGPPQSAKTMFLEAIAKYFNFNQGIPFTLDRATPAGLAELLAARYHAYVFDEIDKADPKTLRVFNEAVESRRVSFVKSRQIIVVKLRPETKFFVGCNSISVLRQKVPEVVTRFLDIPLPPMDFDSFREITWLQLAKRGYTRRQAELIARFAWAKGFRDVRKIRELGKIYPNGRTDEVIRFITYWSKTRKALGSTTKPLKRAAKRRNPLRGAAEEFEQIANRLKRLGRG